MGIWQDTFTHVQSSITGKKKIVLVDFDIYRILKENLKRFWTPRRKSRTAMTPKIIIRAPDSRKLRADPVKGSRLTRYFRLFSFFPIGCPMI